MKKLHKVDGRLIIVFAFLIAICSVLTIVCDDIEDKYEDKFYSKYLNTEKKLKLKNDVYVVTIPSFDGDLANSERNKMNNQYIKELKKLVSTELNHAKGVFLLDNSLLASASVERECLNEFRKADNVFWHYNPKNVDYYHNKDKCGQIKYIDPYYGDSNCFEVYGKGKYAKNYLPYYYMTMDGGKVQYNSQKRKYTITEKTGEKKTLYALRDGTVRIRKTSKYNVKFSPFQLFYQNVVAEKKSDKFKNAVILFQGENTPNSFYQNSGENQDLTNYYIDVIGTIDNEATLASFSNSQKIAFILVWSIVIGIVVLFCSSWISLFVLLAESSTIILMSVLMYDRSICYIPIIGTLSWLVFIYILLTVINTIIKRIVIRNLPIDAVIRFTNNIVNIEHSITYSDYLSKNKAEIEEDLSAVLLMPVMDRDSLFLKELSKENHRNRRFVEDEFGDSLNATSSVTQTRSNIFQSVKYIAFVPLPVFDKESEGITYTVLGLKKKLKPQKASYISMMLFSMYIYFKAQHERGEHQRMYFSMLSLMISVIDAKDPVTAGHSQRVANISKDIGIWLKLSKNEQYDLEFTALLHDIGKIGVSDYVLNKPSVYTQNDFEQMKYHTIRGAEMLSEVGISKEIIEGVRHHHERMDGKGYPDGIKGSEINLFAKIIKIADVFDALTSKRQYKEAWEIEKALNIIYRGKGTEFDEEIAQVFIDHMCPPGWIPPAEENKNKKRNDPMIQKVTKIAQDFYQKYQKYISIEYPIPSKMASNIDFTSTHGFMNYDWGETFNNASFLEEKPMILSYEKETKSLMFGQTCKSEGVSGIYYYFFKGFINMGVYLLSQSGVKKILSEIDRNFGEPLIVDDQTIVYEMNKMRIVFMRTPDDKCLLFYISDYMCFNYIFDKQ